MFHVKHSYFQLVPPHPTHYPTFDSANQQLAHGDIHYAAGGNPYVTRREIIAVLMECSVFPLSVATFRGQPMISLPHTLRSKRPFMLHNGYRRESNSRYAPLNV